MIDLSCVVCVLDRWEPSDHSVTFASCSLGVMPSEWRVVGAMQEETHLSRRGSPWTTGEAVRMQSVKYPWSLT